MNLDYSTLKALRKNHPACLDQKVREQIALWEGSKGKLLEDFFGERDLISESDQGKSFNAFS